MNSFGSWFQRMLGSVSGSLQRFMSGRYGTDRLNLVILCTGLGFSLISSIFRSSWFGIVSWALSYGLMVWAIFRSLSRNINARYQENRRFKLIFDRLKDRNNCYFLCPRCRQTVRVPRHKGKIAITCPRCKERFERRT